uniref:Uncharacterized protein n=1 Tax=Sipha flava TaxID=143950 RepID=A0A2S2Q7C7_9HEMI
MNRGPTVAQSLPVDRYAGNCLIKPSYYCGTGGGVHNAVLESPQCRYDTVVGAAAVGYHNHGGQSATSYQHYQHLQDWYGRTAYWHHHHHLHHHQQHHNQQHHQNSGGVVGGGPLAEKANFAAHKHGVPLIQAAKYNRTSGNGGGGACGGGPGKKFAKKAPAEQPNKKNDGGSDESSGAASENSLPRIIKPRKRRKKERKPVPSALVVMPPLVVAAQERSSSSPSPTPSSPSEQQQQPQQLQQQQQQFSVQPLQEDADGPFDTIRLSADIKAVSLEDVSTCQCACCDPVGNVWDVGRRCFSPSLTRPEPTRRSWSGEPSSPSSSSSSSSSFFKAAVEYAKPESVAPARIRTHSLEVSSEIVTSHNGHRDIEIKFFTMPIGDH